VFAVTSAIDQGPSWNPDVRSVELSGPVRPGTVFRWKAGPGSLTSTLRVVDPPHEIAWTGTTMGIRAVHVFRFQATDGGSLARSEESWNGPLPACSRDSVATPWTRGIRSVLASLKTEAERRVRGREAAPWSPATG
jgi:hypothetical protein